MSAFFQFRPYIPSWWGIGRASSRRIVTLALIIQTLKVGKVDDFVRFRSLEECLSEDRVFQLQGSGSHVGIVPEQAAEVPALALQVPGAGLQERLPLQESIQENRLGNGRACP